MITQATIVTLGIFVAGLVFHAGELRQRVAALEKQHDALSLKIDAILKTVDEIKGMIRGEVS